MWLLECNTILFSWSWFRQQPTVYNDFRLHRLLIITAIIILGNISNPTSVILVERCGLDKKVIGHILNNRREFIIFVGFKQHPICALRYRSDISTESICLLFTWLSCSTLYTDYYYWNFTLLLVCVYIYLFFCFRWLLIDDVTCYCRVDWRAKKCCRYWTHRKRSLHLPEESDSRKSPNDS